VDVFVLFLSVGLLPVFCSFLSSNDFVFFLFPGGFFPGFVFVFCFFITAFLLLFGVLSWGVFVFAFFVFLNMFLLFSGGVCLLCVFDVFGVLFGVSPPLVLILFLVFHFPFVIFYFL